MNENRHAGFLAFLKEAIYGFFLGVIIVRYNPRKFWVGN